MRKGLTESGHVADHAANGPDGLAQALDGRYDALIVDRMLPGMDGLSRHPCAARGEGSDTGADPQRAWPGERSGARTARRRRRLSGEALRFFRAAGPLEALARRAGSDAELEAQTHLRIGDLEMDLLRRAVVRAGRAIELQPREFRLLEFLMRHAGQVVTRTMLLEGVWDYHFDPQTNVIDVHISRLRAKIDKGFDEPLLQTVRGAGYCLRAPT